MKITKQTAYRHTVTQRAMRMEEIVAWVKDERTRDKLALFREKLRRAYPDQTVSVYPEITSVALCRNFSKRRVEGV